MLGLIKRSNTDGDLGLEERPEPVAGPGRVVLEVGAAGICGTDLHILKGEYQVVPPVTIGHEVCGRVIAVGDGVDEAEIGCRVVYETFFDTCGACRYCRDGRPNMCGNRRSIGTHVDGVMAPYVEVPVHAPHTAPDGLSDAAASLAEPVACVTNSLFGETPYIGPGDDILVVGPGAIGLIAAQVARACGAPATVRGTVRDAARLARAVDLGFATSLVGEDEIDAGFDGAVECSGTANGAVDALRRLRKRGHMMLMGPSDHEATLPLDLVCYRELTLTSGFASTPRSWARAMPLIASGAVAPEPLVSEVLPLIAWREAFDRSLGADGIKFVLAPGLD